jgi:cobalt/nickel transport system permease protein
MSGLHRLQTRALLDSPLRRVPAPIKLLAVLAFVTGLALVSPANMVGIELALVLVLAVAIIARVPLSTLLAHLALAQPFALGVAVLALFQGRGLLVFAALAIKSTACVTALQLLAFTTPFSELLDALRRARIPESLVLTLSFLHRYLFVLVEESRRMRRARLARTWRPSLWASWQALSSVIAVSFVRSVARAERIAVAMRARGCS